MGSEEQHFPKTRRTPRGIRASELELIGGGVEKVPVPWRKNRWICPQCEREIPPQRIIFFGKPPKYADMLYDIIKCCWCRFAFAPKMEATVLRR